MKQKLVLCEKKSGGSAGGCFKRMGGPCWWLGLLLASQTQREGVGVRETYGPRPGQVSGVWGGKRHAGGIAPSEGRAIRETLTGRCGAGVGDWGRVSCMTLTYRVRARSTDGRLFTLLCCRFLWHQLLLQVPTLPGPSPHLVLVARLPPST